MPRKPSEVREYGNREEVWVGKALHTHGGLYKQHLIENPDGSIGTIPKRDRVVIDKKAVPSAPTEDARKATLEKNRQRMKIYYANNKEKFKAARLKWYEKQKEAMHFMLSAKAKENHQENVEVSC